jgi:hypothetical protein
MRARWWRLRETRRREYVPLTRGPEEGGSEKEIAEETERWRKLAAQTTNLEGKCKHIGRGDEASEVS